MFDIGFFELMLVAIVGLLVVGPERLPDAIRTTARWWSGLKRTLHNAREELEREVGADDIRRELHNERIMRELEESRRELEESRRELEASVREPLAEPGAQRESEVKAGADEVELPETSRAEASDYLPEDEGGRETSEHLPEEEDEELEDPEYPEHLHDHGDPEFNPHHPDHFKDEPRSTKDEDKSA
ncbi:twin-arginine translocase subunit TatB [Microbulbifer flavimaris]|uniref:Sec-independent protein translocase protein TatB n=1 Tax=Microbulbifer flavimaris TaxID=1781068 RepID=A0ABX4I157_9GAMM|nr:MULTISPECIES: Sec-independent protein translocase protein TatB [Microbulbifer]KUJ83877.1 peptidyl-tRNA hydrolase [Microbulbifer sp. ZGT114]PCO06056.1 twin-arginine translocase subunit TatB [Microbulbifer flavimaris]